MIPAVYKLIEGIAEQLKPPYLEIGSFQVPGQEQYDLRNIFKEQFIGIDMRMGKGVDYVSNITKGSEWIGNTVICVDTLEHIFDVFSAIENIKESLTPDGVVIISVPFAHHIHDYPSDYWRFTPESLKQLFKEFKYVQIVTFGPDINPHHVIAIISNRLINLPDIDKLKRQFNKWLFRAKVRNILIKIKRKIKS